MQKRSIGIIVSYTYTFLNMICSLVMSAFLLRMLGDDEYGLYQTVSAFAMYLVMLEFGTGTVMGRNVALCRGSGNIEKIKNNISTIWYTTLFLSVIILTVSVIFCLNIGNIYQKTMNETQIVYSQQIFVVMTGYLILSFFTHTLNGLLLGMEQYTFAHTANIVKLIFRTGLLFTIISFKPYAMVIALIDLIVSFATFVSTFIFCKKKYKIKLSIKFFDKSILIDSLPLCLALLLQTIINQANSSIDKFIIGIKMSLESVALYSVAQYIYTLFSSVTTIPISMYLPQVAKDISAGLKGKELTKTLVQPCRLVVIIGGTLLGGFIAVGKPFINIFYGASKEQAWIYALITTIPMFINMTNGVILNILDITNKRLVRSSALAGTTLLNIILTLLLIDEYGILGAVSATAVALILGNVLVMNFYYQKALKLDVLYLYYHAYKGLLIFQIIAAVVGYFVAEFVANENLKFICGGTVYVVLCAVLIILFGLNKTEKSMLCAVVKRFKIFSR